MSEANALLVGRKISKEFGYGKKKVVAVNQVDFDFHEGEIISIVGESGSGKTTLAKERVQQALSKIQQVWLNAMQQMYEITSPNNEGGCTIGWLDTWSPGKHGQMQCDLSVMISPDMFHEFIMPELRSQTEWMDNALYHFDGVDQIKHLDALLSIEKLKMIQWTCVEGQPSPIEFIPILKKIQEAGKGLLIKIKKEELEPLMEELSSKGLYLQLTASTEEEAKSIIRKVESLTHD